MSSHICDGERVALPFKGCPNPQHYKARVSPMDYRHTKERDFGRGLHSYREAKRNGLQPDQPTEKAVRKAEYRAEVTERVTKKHG